MRNDPGAEQYAKVATALFQVLPNVQLQFFPAARTVQKQLDETLQVWIDDGVATISKIAILDESGSARLARRMDTITRNVVNNATADCDGDLVDASDGTGTVYFHHYYPHNNLGERYGLSPVDSRARYSVDYERRLITFASADVEAGDYVLIEYAMLPGYGETNEVLIPETMAFAMELMVRSVLERNSGQAFNWRRMAAEEMRIHQKNTAGFNLEDVIKALRGGYSAATRR